MILRFKKKSDGTPTMTCIRPDGSATGMRSGEHFVGHDLSHYAIETTLGLHHAFYGQVTEGWDLEDFGSPWPRGPIPAKYSEDTSTAEGLAGLLDLERYGQPEFTAAYATDCIRGMCEQAGGDYRRVVTEDELRRVRARRRELAAQWEAVPLGGVMELSFPANCANAEAA